MELFQWSSNEQSRNLVKEAGTQALVAGELADVMIYCFILAGQSDIDISSAVRVKLERNRGRFPVGYMPTAED